MTRHLSLNNISHSARGKESEYLQIKIIKQITVIFISKRFKNKYLVFSKPYIKSRNFTYTHPLLRHVNPGLRLRRLYFKSFGAIVLPTFVMNLVPWYPGIVVQCFKS